MYLKISYKSIIYKFSVVLNTFRKYFYNKTISKMFLFIFGNKSYKHKILLNIFNCIILYNKNR